MARNVPADFRVDQPADEVLANYLSKEADSPYESDEAMSSDEEDTGSEIDVDWDNHPDANDYDDWDIMRKQFGAGQPGDEWFDGSKSKNVLSSCFFQLRKDLHDTELQIEELIGRKPQWPGSHGHGVRSSAEGEASLIPRFAGMAISGGSQDNSDLVGRLGQVTKEDVYNAESITVVMWMVDMCKALDKLEAELDELERSACPRPFV